MGDRDRDKYRSRKNYDRDRRSKRYDDDDDDDYRERRDRRREPKTTVVERILTPGKTANNIIKTAATGVIAGGTVLLMCIYGFAGDNLAGSQFLPLATAVSSAVATACVWIFGRPKTEEVYNEEFSILRKEMRSLNTELEDLQAQNTELEERLANVELLESFEDKLAKHTLDKQLQTQTKTTAQRSPSPAPISSNMPSSSEAASEESSAPQRETE